MAIAIILAVIAVLIIITCIKALFYKDSKPDVTPLPNENVNSERVQKHLSEAISYKTISNTDDSKVDWSEFERFHDFLEREFPLTHRHLKREKISNASLLFTWEGKNPELDAIGILSHQDVVPIEAGTENDWTHPPFEGYNDGEYIWGRGALDMKNFLICAIEAVETLLEEGYQPERTVYLCFGHNEEIVAGPNNGAHAIAQTLHERGVHLDSTIDEGGAIIKAKIKGILDGNLVGVGIGEKGYSDIKVSVKGIGGHSSQPPKHTASGEISKVVEDLENNQFKSKMLPSVYNMINIVGKRASLPVRLVLCNLKYLKPLVFAVANKFPPAATFFRTTTACTMLQASPAANVLPQKASVTINFRQLPGTSIEDTINHIKKVVRNEDIEIEFLKGKEASKVSPIDTKSFEALTELFHQIDDTNIVAPYLVMGGTDSYHYETVCDNIYRIAPFTFGVDLLSTTHSTNERCPVEQLDQGVQFFMRYIKMMTN